MTKNWKKTGYLIPDVIEPEENICVCVPVPKDWGHINAFLGQITELAKWLTWEKDGTDSALRSARRWMEITQCVIDEVNCAMANNCGCGGSGTPTNQRYTEDGHLEVSYDGGETWENGDAIDPRFNSPVFSPIPGEDGGEKRCAAANSAMAVIESAKGEASAVLAGAAGVAGLVAAVVGLLASTGIGVVAAVVIGLMGAVLVAIASGGQAAFDASFSTLVWDELFCSLYCNMEADGSFTEAGWQQVVNDAATGASYPANDWLSHIIKTMSPVGLTNAARSGYAGTRDCDSCPCDDEWCYIFDFINVGDEEWFLQPRNLSTFGTYELGSGWVYTDNTAVQAGITTGSREVRIARIFDNSEITKVTVFYNYAFGHSDSTALQAFDLSVGGTVRLTKTFATLPAGGAQEQTWENPGVLATSIEVGLRSSRDPSAPITYSGDAVILEILVEGRGTNPFGADNC